MQPPVKLFKGGEEKQKYKEKIMKKFFGLALAGIMAASTVAFAAPAYGVSADEAAAAKKFTVTYKDGDNSLGTSKYTYGGNEAMKTAPEKEGYTFEGWYSDASFSADKKVEALGIPTLESIPLFFEGWYSDASFSADKQVEALDYNNPANITLYAKYVKTGGNSGSGSTDNGGNKGGCKSSVAGIGGVAMLMGVAAVYTLARKKKED